MHKTKPFQLLTIIIAVLLIPVVSHSNNKADTEGDVGKKAIMAKAMNLQIPFIENQGQVDKSVAFYANTFAGNVYVTEKGEIVYSLPKVEANSKNADTKGQKPEPKISKVAMLRETLIGAKSAKSKGIDRAETKVNYFIGSDRSKWKNNLPTYNSVSLGEVYDNIELKLKAYGNNVEKLFIVKPGGNPEDIRIKVEGVPPQPHLLTSGEKEGRVLATLQPDSKGIKVNDKGELEIETELGCVKFTKPYAYQEIDGKRVEVVCDFRLQNCRLKKSNSKFRNLKSEISNLQSTYGFTLASYNPNYPLIIDPLLASTFIGGGGLYGDEPHAIAINSSGDVFVTGHTESSDYPTTSGAYDTSYNGGYSDVFVSRLDSSLSTLLASTFIGGSDDDSASAIAINSSGDVFVTGTTYSSDYPTTSGAYDTSHNGGDYDGFVSRLDSSLSTLLASTFIGGSSLDSASAIAIDSSGNVFVTGHIYSSDYPTTSGAYDTSHNGFYDGFVSRLDSSLSTLLASTFIGGAGFYADEPHDIAINSSGDIFVTGHTESPDYPTTSGAYDTSHNGGDYDGFVSRLDSSLSTLFASTFIGGAGLHGDEPKAIAINSSGDIFVTGTTESSDYPTTSGAYDTSYNGSYDVFVSKLDSNLSSGTATTTTTTITSSTSSTTATTTSTTSSTTTTTCCKLPDLRAGKVRVKRKVKIGSKVKIKTVVKNIDKAKAPKSMVSFYISPNNNKSIDEGDIPLGEKMISKVLKKKESKSVKIKAEIPSELERGRKYYIKAFCDSNKVVDESKEDNNIRVSKRVKVK